MKPCDESIRYKFIKLILVLSNHEGEECYSKCNGNQGKCEWCGEGLCCRKGFEGGGCDGSFGGQSNHQCVTKPPGDKISYILLPCPSIGQKLLFLETSKTLFLD